MIVSMKWDPTGKILLTCAKEETVKLWGYMGGSWRRLHSLPHPALVNGIAWCALPGKGPKLQLLLATYVIFLFVLALLQLGILLLVVGRIKKKKKKDTVINV